MSKAETWMTPEDAVAKYKAVLRDAYCFDPKECQMCAEHKVALDAAVKDVALAGIGAMRDRGGYVCEAAEDIVAEIERLFGEGGKER